MMLFLMLFNLLAKYLSYQLQTCLDTSPQRPESSHHTETSHDSTGEELQHPNMSCVCDVAGDQGFSIQDNGTTGDEGNCERSISGNRPRRTGVCMCTICHNRN